MADKKISQLTTLAQADVAVTADFLPIVDTSATETKKATPQALVQAGATGATLPVALGAVGTPSYTFTGDLNTGMWSPAADTVALSTGGSERLRVDSSGNVGIGTTSPAGKVACQVTASGTFQNAYVASDGSSSDFLVRIRTNETQVMNTGASVLSFGTSNTERMRLDSSGNLGIGTASPTYKLQVAGTSGTVALGLTGTHASGDIGLYIVPSAITGSYNAINSAPSATTGVNYNFGNANNSSATADSRADIYTTSASGGDPKLTLSISGVRNWSVGVDNSASDQFCISASDAPGNTDRLTIDTNGSATIGAGSVATNATDGFLYVPTCAGTPTGTPTAKSGYAPIVVDTTNNKMYFYSGGQWRDAGP